ncbi:MAG: hypothetical protein ACC650_11070, partial [Gammaproteobacteria bacterium]
NPAALKLQQDLALQQVVDLLPLAHKGLVCACLKTGITLTGECLSGERNMVWSYQPGGENDTVYIYGHDVTAYQSEPSAVRGLPQSNPNPVLTYSIEGDLQFKNRAVSILLNELKLDNVKYILPGNHERLVQSCLETSAPVAGDQQVFGRSMVWSYCLSDDGESVHIYGHDVTKLYPEDASGYSLPEINPNPVVTSGPDGKTHYANNATLLLLLDLELDEVEDLLPQSHKGMVKACYTTKTSLTIQHQAGEKTFIWSYHPVGVSEVIYIYGHDVTGYEANANKG